MADSIRDRVADASTRAREYITGGQGSINAKKSIPDGGNSPNLSQTNAVQPNPTSPATKAKFQSGAGLYGSSKSGEILKGLLTKEAKKSNAWEKLKAKTTKDQKGFKTKAQYQKQILKTLGVEGKLKPEALRELGEKVTTDPREVSPNNLQKQFLQDTEKTFEILNKHIKDGPTIDKMYDNMNKLLEENGVDGRYA